MRVDEIFRDCLAILARRFPTLYFLLRQLRVVYKDDQGLAETDGRVIRLYRGWMEQDEIGRIVTLIHELIHVLLKHPFRKVEMVSRKLSEGYNPKVLDVLANVAMDAKVNFYIRSLGIKYELCFYSFNLNELKKLSVEELFELLLNRKMVGFPCDLVKPGSLGMDGLILNEGKRDLIDASPEILEDILDRVIAESLIAAKTAGHRLTGFEEWILNDLFRSGVSWRCLLRQTITDGIAKTFMQTWIRISRKSKDFPGYRQISKPHIWCFVDVSGSVSYEEFKLFMSEVLRASKESSGVTLVTWDVRVKDVKRVRSFRDVIGVRFRRGGGTRFAPVISEFRDRIKATDVLVCLTDGCWADVEMAVPLIRKVRAIRKILVTTYRDVEGFDTVIRIR